jgi:enoyl-[acyl-carrier protein] reductase I
MIDLKGKVAVVFGLANKRSIAYSVAQKMAEAGATIVLSYQSSTGRAFQCDVSRDEQIDALFSQLAAAFPKIDILIHSIGFAPGDALKNDFLLTSREDFRIAHDVSVYSLIALARGAAPLMSDGGAILTLTYYGAEKVFPNYNVMGVAKAALESAMRYLAASLGPRNIRVNAVSAGPIKTLAARGIGDFSQILTTVTSRAPLHRNVEQAEVGNTALFLCSPLASGITGEVTFVDCGFNITGI